MLAVLDVNVLISALLSRDGTPAHLLIAWQAGEFDLVVSPLLLVELKRALAYPKLRRHIPEEEATRFVDWLRQTATLAVDPQTRPPVHASDPADDYLIALAAAQHAVLVSGDAHLLSIGADFPIYAPARFRETPADSIGAAPDLEVRDRDDWDRA